MGYSGLELLTVAAMETTLEIELTPERYRAVNAYLTLYKRLDDMGEYEAQAALDRVWRMAEKAFGVKLGRQVLTSIAIAEGQKHVRQLERSHRRAA